MAKRKGSKRSKSVLGKPCAQERCCPTITIACKMGTPPAKRVRETYVGKDGKKRSYTYAQKSMPTKICTVKRGHTVVLKNATGAEAGKKVGALKRALEARRCKVSVRSLGKGA